MKSNVKINLTEPQIAEVAEELDSGLCAFYNLKTTELTFLPSSENGYDLPEEEEEQWQEIEENENNYFELKKLDTRQSFIMMEDFTETISDDKFKTRLLQALNKPKPFRNFKFEIDNNPQYRQQWFGFKKLKIMDWVKEQVNAYNLSQDQKRE